MTSLLRAGLLAREFAHNRRFERATANPQASQARVLLSLTRRNADTVFGHEHGFGSIRTTDDFARSVPIRDYEGFRPYVDRIIAGHAGVLTTDPVTMFATTSGTTAEPKLIPAPDRWRDQMASLMRLWMYRALEQHPQYLDQKVLLIVSPAVEGHTATGMPFGALSGMTYQRIPRLVQRSYAVPYEVALVKEPETRYFLTMRLALARSVSAVGTPNPTSLTRLAETAIARSEDIVRAVHDGGLGLPNEALAPLEAQAVRRLRAAARPDRTRARFLEQVISEHGALRPHACWPSLSVIGCWLGGAAWLHAERLSTYFGQAAALRDLGLLASEGRMTVPVEDATAAGPLAVHANFYEFIPHDDIDTASPTVLGAHQLELGERYYILITGGNGLYRYDINDVVEVVGFHNATPKLAFVRKGREMVSITGEKIHVNQVRSALRAASRDSGLSVLEFRLIPDAESLRHDVLVEFQGRATDHSSLLTFLKSFDGSLQAENREYQSRRTSRRLGAPQLYVMRPGWSEEACRGEFRRGRREPQHKWMAMGADWDVHSRRAVLTCLSVDSRQPTAPGSMEGDRPCGRDKR